MTALVDVPSVYDPQAVLAAEEMVREYCGWHIAPARTETITVNGSDGRVLLLPTLRITAITAIVEDGITLPATSYRWSEDGRVEKLYSYWTWKLRSIQVTLTHGYDKCPLAVRREVERLSAAGFAIPPALSDDSRVALGAYELRSY